MIATTTPASAGATPAATAAPTIRVWDAPVRVFHWLLALSFLGAWLTAEGERWRLMHVTLGYTMAGLLVFRLLWGLVGTRHARFADFVRGPRAVWDYLRSLPHPPHYAGHNPLGGWMILSLLALTAVTTGLGWAADQELGGEWLEELHEGAATLMLVLVVGHIAGVVIGSWMHRENLVRAMLTGRKPGAPQEDNGPPWRVLAALLLAAVLGFWALQWQQTPLLPSASAGREQAGDDD